MWRGDQDNIVGILHAKALLRLVNDLGTHQREHRQGDMNALALGVSPEAPPLPFVQKAFETIALAKTSSSALDAKRLGFLEENDRVVMNPDHLLSAARREVHDLADAFGGRRTPRFCFCAGSLPLRRSASMARKSCAPSTSTSPISVPKTAGVRRSMPTASRATRPSTI